MLTNHRLNSDPDFSTVTLPQSQRPFDAGTGAPGSRSAGRPGASRASGSQRTFLPVTKQACKRLGGCRASLRHSYFTLSLST